MQQLDIEAGDVRPLVQRQDGQWLPCGVTRTQTDKPTVPFANIPAAMAAIERYRVSAGQTRIRDQFTINIDTPPTVTTGEQMTTTTDAPTVTDTDVEPCE